MKIKKMILTAVVGFILTSCNQYKVWDPERDGAPEKPAYISFVKMESEVVFWDKNMASYEGYIPIYSEMVDGSLSLGERKYWSVEIIEQESTAVEGVHYLLEKVSPGETPIRSMKVMPVPIGEGIVGCLTVLPRNITSAVTLVLKMPTESKSVESKARPNIEKTIITIRPVLN